MPVPARHRTHTDIWPGFVDALSALIMVIIFLLMLFVVAQFFLNQAIVGREKEVDALNTRMSELSNMLAMEQSQNQELTNTITLLEGDLSASLRAQQQLQTSLATAQENLSNINTEYEEAKTQLKEDATEIARLNQSLSALENRIEALQALRESLVGEIAANEEKLDEETQKRIESEAEMTRLNQQIDAFREQLSELNNLLDAAEQREKEANSQIVDLGKRLNVALASKVSELSQYRSEFFGRLRQILGDREDIKIVGDRFVFQSEVLFDQGQANLGVEGRLQLARLARSLKEITSQIPSEINWVLQVDGHTDSIPISTAEFGSNWELSTARALSVVYFLIDQGIAPENLSAAGFGEFQPLIDSDDPLQFKQNRRIELKLTNR